MSEIQIIGNKKATAPRGSVVLPIYNGEKYLSYAIESVLKQSFRDYELLLMDDGSSDRSLEIIKNYAKRDDRCRVFTRPNKGLIYTLNEGIENSRGEIIFRMDADDVCAPDRFMRQVEFLEKNPKCVAVGSKIILIDDEGLEICQFLAGITHEEIDARHLSGLSGIGGALCHPSAAIRKQALITINGYREDYKYTEDLDLFLRLAEIGMLANIDEPLLFYRQHVASVCHTSSGEQRLSGENAIRAAIQRRGIVNPPKINSRVPSKILLADLYKKWAWWAIGAGNIMAARKYARKLIFNAPFSMQTWKIWYCIFRGY